jgi:hypothetical protein
LLIADGGTSGAGLAVQDMAAMVDSQTVIVTSLMEDLNQAMIWLALVIIVATLVWTFRQLQR